MFDTRAALKRAYELLIDAKAEPKCPRWVIVKRQQQADDDASAHGERSQQPDHEQHIGHGKGPDAPPLPKGRVGPPGGLTVSRTRQPRGENQLNDSQLVGGKADMS